MSFNPFKAVVDLGKSILNAAKDIITTVFNVVAKVVSSVINFVIQPFLGLFGIPNMPDAAQEANRQQGVLIQQQGSDVKIPVIYGYRKVGGIVTYAETGSTSNKYLWVAYVLCEGPIEGLNELFIDDHPVNLTTIQDLNAGKLVTISDTYNILDVNNNVVTVNSKYKDRVQFRFYNGIYYDNPASSPVGTDTLAGIMAGAPSFKNTMVFNGMAVLFARYEWKQIVTQADADNNPFNGAIPIIQASVLGKKVVQLATVSYNADNTVNSAKSATLLSAVNSYWSSSTAYDTNAGRYSTNPTEILFDYLRNPRYGKGLLLADLDQDTWMKAANKCNQIVKYYTGATGPIMTCNYVLDTNQTLMTNTKSLLAGFRAYMPYIQGKYKLKIEDAGNPSDILSGVAYIIQTITKDQIVGNVTYSGIERTAKYNQAIVTYVDPDQKWSNQQAVWPATEAERLQFITYDGGRENKAEVTMGTITNSIMAQDMARLIFNKSRYQESCALTVSAQGFELEPGDNIYIQSNLLNFGTIPWRIVSTKMNNNYTFDLACVRNPDNIYPYGRYNEPDVVLPLYVPAGNQVYYPTLYNPFIGIFPPTHAPIPPELIPGYTPPPGNTPPTDTGGGGGVGGGGGSSNGGVVVGGGGGTGNGGSPTPTVTYNDVVTYTSAIFDTTNNTWTVNFTKPANVGSYNGLMLWYSPTTTDKYIQAADIAISSTSFTFPASSDAIVSYKIITRVKYTGGQVSTDAETALLSRTAGLTNQLRGFNFSFGNITIIDPNATNLDAPIYMVNYVNSNPATAPKTVTFKIKEPVTTGIIGCTKMTSIMIYYKSNSPTLATTYSQYEYVLPSTYNPNTEFTFTLQDFGSTPTAYDVVFRWKFNGVTLGNLIFQNIIYLTPPGSTAIGSANGGKLASQVPITISPAGSTSSNTTLSINSIQGGGTSASTTMKVWVNDPTVAPLNLTNWKGYKVEIARIIAGQPIAYDIIGEGAVGSGLDGTYAGSSGYNLSISNSAFSNVSGYYNIIITLSYFNAGTTQYSTKSVKFSNMNFNGSSSINQMSTAVMSTGDYTILKGDGGTVQPGGTSSDQIMVPTNLIDIALPSTGAKSTDTLKLPSFGITFTMPTGASKIRVYRSITNGTIEYTEYTSSGTYQFRYAITGQQYGNGSYAVSTNTYAHTIYIVVYTGSTASTNALRILPQDNANGSKNNVSILGSAFNSVSNTVLTSTIPAGQSATAISVGYNTTDSGWLTGTIS